MILFQMVIGFLMWFLGIKWLGRILSSNQPGPQPVTGPTPTPKPDQDLDRISSALKLLEQGRELDQLLLRDAYAREARAKAALRELLTSIGADERQISSVLQDVDSSSGVTDGDRS